MRMIEKNLAICFFLGLSSTGCDQIIPSKEDDRVALDSAEAEEEGVSTEETSSEKSIEETPTVYDEVIQSTAAVRNYAQLYTTYADLTGIPESDTEYKSYFETSVSGTLPTKNDIDLFSASHQVSVVNLASFALERSLILGVDNQWSSGRCSTGVPADVFNYENKLLLAKALFSRFWGIGEDIISADSGIFQDFSKLVDDLISHAQSVNPDISDENLVRGVCVGAATSALSSSIVTTYGG